MQTILGAGGTISNNAAAALRQFTNDIRLVGRNPKPVVGDERLQAANLLRPLEAENAVAGSTVVYLCVGLRYSTAFWETNWPLLMENVIKACLRFNSRLVFFDNVYALGHVEGWMTEDSPLWPCSGKGEVRAKLQRMIEKAHAEHGLPYIIARAPDFYGPSTHNSMTHALIFERLNKGKRARWFGSTEHLHSFIYTPDAGKALALLGNTNDAYNQIWHLPTCAETLTAGQFIAESAKHFEAPDGIQTLGSSILSLLGLFIPILKESKEMLYQFERPYLFSSKKFMQSFPDFPTTDYLSGIRQTAAYYRKA